MSYKKILQNIAAHNQYRGECLNLIAAENVMSPASQRALSSDLNNRYTVGQPGNRWYAGSQYFDHIEQTAIDLAKKLFHAKYANVQALSGMMANLTAYFTLLKPGDLVMSLPVRNSGHYSHVQTGMLALFQARVDFLEFDEKNYTIDIERSISKIKKLKPKLVILGTSEFLFPAPVRELKKICDQVGCKILYDAAHVAGLIAGQSFQNPLQEGADFLSFSTNKTLGGPDQGIVACNDSSYRKKIEYAIVPMFTSNQHAHHIAGVAITLAEFEQFGPQYSQQIIKNAKTLASSLYNEGVDVLCPHKNFTESHTVLCNVKNSGKSAMKNLEKANIITNYFQLPQNTANNPTGIRLGTNELTRLGMKEKEMKKVGQYLAAIILNKSSKEKIKKQVAELRHNFQKIHYCFH